MINFDIFKTWADTKFEGNIIVKDDDEIKLNSIFCEDKKHHLWCSTEIGPRGAYHCWKTGNSGNLIDLVMRVDKSSYKEACATLHLGAINRNIEEEFDAMFYGEKKEIKTTIEVKEEKNEGDFLPPQTYSILALSENDPFRKDAEIYLRKRNISPKGLMICIEGNYFNRIIIPYYDKEGNLIYFNARYIGESDKVLRYMGPSAKLGVRKQDVIYFPVWPKDKSKVYLTEGEFDAMALYSCGLNSAACGGKNLSDKQAIILKQYNIVLALDNDEAGKGAILKMGDKLLSYSSNKITFVRPPKNYKDWNTMFIDCKPDVIKGYLNEFEREYKGGF